MLSLEAALALVLADVVPTPAERVSVFEADGRVLAQDVVAPFALPSFDHSAMDGYALAAGAVPDTLELPLVGLSAAGGALPSYTPGTACRIFTGAPLPAGADTVVMQEKVTVDEARGLVVLAARPRLGDNVRREGEDLAAGAVALARGARLGPGQVALAAALDRASLLVHARPMVTVIGSGDELRSPGEPGRPGAVVESNGLFIAAACRRAGGTVRLGAFVRDDVAEARRAFERAIAGSDLVVTVGGVSVGDRDVVRPALEAAGVDVRFHRVAIKPGRPVLFGAHPSGARVLGLPGNPASASMTCLLFAVPLVRRLSGDGALALGARAMPIRGEAKSAEGRTDLLRGRIEAGAFVVAANQSSGAVTSFASATAVAIVPPGRIHVQEGDILDVLPLADIL